MSTASRPLAACPTMSDVLLGAEQGRQAFAHDLVVVHEKHAQKTIDRFGSLASTAASDSSAGCHRRFRHDLPAKPSGGRGLEMRNVLPLPTALLDSHPAAEQLDAFANAHQSESAGRVQRAANRSRILCRRWSATHGPGRTAARNRASVDPGMLDHVEQRSPGPPCRERPGAARNAARSGRGPRRGR